MYNAIMIEVTKEHELYEYFKSCCEKSKNLKNVANFYIRQVMTGIKKPENERQQNEKDILKIVEETIPKVNERKQENLQKKLAKIAKEDISLEEKAKKIKKAHKEAEPFFIPTEDKWYMNYGVVEGVLRLSENKDYLALPSQVNQQCLQEIETNWTSYFNSLRDYNENPSKYLGKPNLPKYKKTIMSNCVFTNGVCKFKKDKERTYMIFPKTKATLNLGTYIKGTEKLATVNVIPYYDRFKVVITLGKPEKKLDEQEKAAIEKAKYDNAKRIFAIDLGINNLASISNNIGIKPIVIKGGYVKSKNQYFNKRRAYLCSKVQKGTDSKNSIKHTNRLNNLSRNRTNFFRDYFFKVAHFITKEAKANNIDTIIIGHSKLWKQNINIGKQNDQAFTSIPFDKLIYAITYIAEKNDINVILIEESYTSKASFLDMDNIPTYKENNNEEYSFNGKRIKRGLYKSKKGIIINADINGASNILRKAIPNAFKEINDYSYLTGKIESIGFDKFYTKKINKSIPHKDRGPCDGPISILKDIA